VRNAPAPAATRAVRTQARPPALKPGSAS
jgi:hypothetical protein